MQWTLNGVHFPVTYSPLISFLIVFTGSKIAGHRGYFLTNDGIDLNQALISYGLDFLRKRGYKKIQPPFMMNKDVMAKTAQLDQFDEELYKVHRTLNTPVLLSNNIRAYRSLGATTRNTSLPPLSSPSRHSTRTSGLRTQRNSFQSSTLVTRHVSARRQAQPVVTCGAFSVCISLRRSNSSASPTRKSRGRCLIRWLPHRRNSIKASGSHTV